MFNATKNKPLATTVTGSLPRPSWFTTDLHGRSLSIGMGDRIFREQYTDAVQAVIGDQTRAGLDIVTDGDMRFDLDIGGRSWFGYIFDRMEGLGSVNVRRQKYPSGREATPGDILQEVSETRLPPVIEGKVGRGRLEYADVWKAAQRLTHKPVKIGGCSVQWIEVYAENKFYKSRLDALMALSKAMNEEHHAVADAGSPVIQIEEPAIHFNAEGDLGISQENYVKAFNIEVKGLRKKTEVWCHTCWGNPFAQRIEVPYGYKPSLKFLDQLDVDVITFEGATNGGNELKEIGAAISSDKKVCIGVVDHHTLAVERPEQVAALIRKALKHIKPERLLISSDCGFGRQGMSRAHAFYKMVSLVWGTNMVRKELGLPEVPILAADKRYALM